MTEPQYASTKTARAPTGPEGGREAPRSTTSLRGRLRQATSFAEQETMLQPPADEAPPASTPSVGEQLTRSIQGTYQAYAEIPITLEIDGVQTVIGVRAPYFMIPEDLPDEEAQRDGYCADPSQWDPDRTRTPERYCDARANRQSAPRAVDQIFHDIERQARRGKATPEDLQQALEAAVEAGLIPDPIDGESLRTFLVDYGLGVDCSGFVRIALMRGADELGVDTTVRDGATAQQGGARDMRVVAPTDLRPADTVHMVGHILIIEEVTIEEGLTVFTTRESAGTPEGPATRRWRLRPLADGEAAAGKKVIEGFVLEVEDDGAWGDVERPSSFPDPVFGRLEAIAQAYDAEDAAATAAP